MYVFDFNKLNIDNEEVVIHEVLLSMITRINEAADEPITGVLLLYDKYGVNMIEVSWMSLRSDLCRRLTVWSSG